MNRTYPGFHRWWQQRQPRQDPREQARIPLQVWSEQRPAQPAPDSADRLAYRRVALEW